MTSITVVSSQQKMSTTIPGDHSTVPNPVTYQILSWVIIGEFALGLPLNLSVLYIFIFRFKFWKNKSLFLFNIVVADLLLVACLPVEAYIYQQGLRRSNNNVVCKTLLAIKFINRGASISFLLILCAHRYFSVIHLGRGNFAKVLKKSLQLSILIWLLLLPFLIPVMFKSFVCCSRRPFELAVIYKEAIFFIVIIIPFIILVYCTVLLVSRLRKKTVGEKKKLRKAVWAVMAAVVVFSICFLPCTIAKGVLLSFRLTDWRAAEDVAIQVFDSLAVLSYADCLLDPLVYCFCNSGFKNAYISSFCPTVLKERLMKSDDGMRTGATPTTSGDRTVSLAIVEK